MSQVHKAYMDSLLEQSLVPIPVKFMMSDGTISEKPKNCIEISSHKMTLKITENISDSLLAKVLGVLCSC